MSAKNLAYVKGCFCFEDRTNYVNGEIELSEKFSKILHNLIYSSPVDESDIEDLVQMAHELKHLIQDLSLTSCQVERRLLSDISMFCSLRPNFLKEGQALLSKDGQINPFYFNERFVDPIAVLLCDYISFYFKYFLAKDKIPYSGQRLTVWTKKAFDDISLSYIDLLESHAHFQSLKMILDKVNHNLVVPMETAKNVPRYFPMKVTEKGELLLDARQIKYNGRYFNPFILYFSATGSSIWWGDIINYFNTCFPKLSDTHPGVDVEVLNCLNFYHMVMETALMLPSYAFLADSNDDYNPVHRYVRVLNFISSLTRDRIYAYATGKFTVFFDECAAKYGWLSYKETLNTFKSSDKERNTCIYDQCLYDACKLREDMDYNVFNFVLGPPKLPLVLRNDAHLRISYAEQKVFFADCLYKNFSEAFFREYEKWQNKELESVEMHNIQGAILKDIAGLLCRNSVSKAFVTGEKLSCPLKNNECPHRCGLCDNINDIESFRVHMNNMLNHHNEGTYPCIFLHSIRFR